MNFSNTSIEALTFTEEETKQLGKIKWQFEQSETFDDIMEIISENCFPIGKVIDLAHFKTMQMIGKFINLDDPSEEITIQYLLEYERAKKMNDRNLEIINTVIKRTPINTIEEKAKKIISMFQKISSHVRFIDLISRIIFETISRTIEANETDAREKDSGLTVKPDYNSESPANSQFTSSNFIECNQPEDDSALSRSGDNAESPASPQFTSNNFIECNQPEDNSALSQSGDKEPQQQPLNLNSGFCEETYTHDKAEKPKIEKNNNQKSCTAPKVGFALLTTCCLIVAALYRSASLYMMGIIATIATCYLIFSPQLPSTELTLTELIQNQNSQDTQKTKWRI